MFTYLLEAELLFFTQGGCASCLRACLGARLLPQSYQYPNLSEGAGQLRGDKECPFSGITKSGRVWRKVPESDARSVGGSRGRGKNLVPSVVSSYSSCHWRLKSSIFCSTPPPTFFLSFFFICFVLVFMPPPVCSYDRQLSVSVHGSATVLCDVQNSINYASCWRTRNGFMRCTK